MKEIIEKYKSRLVFETTFGPVTTVDHIPQEHLPALTADLESERDAYALRFAEWLCEWYVPCGDNEWTPDTGPHHPKTTEELLKIYTDGN